VVEGQTRPDTPLVEVSADGHGRRADFTTTPAARKCTRSQTSTGRPSLRSRARIGAPYP
jgi:hypothetical protein